MRTKRKISRASLKKRTARKRTTKKRPTRKPSTPKKAGSKKKKVLARKKPTRKRGTSAKNAGTRNAKNAGTRKLGRRNETSPFDAPVTIVTGLADQSDVQAGDLQGLSEIASSDSESVRELMEEGSPFEAEVVQGVQDAGAKGRRVRSHEVSEDDLPEEYRDQD
jgi:hypothetical protein